MKLAELPFHERPVRELLGFVEGRAELDRDWAGYGWAKADVWLVDAKQERLVEDALVIAVHSPDDSEPIADDIDLEFELPNGGSVLVALSLFLATWLPKLPPARVVVLAVCNPHRARVKPIGVPLWYPDGDVEAWSDDRGILLEAETWYHA